MKQILSMSVAIMATVNCLAQPILTNTNSSPIAGERFFSRNCMKAGVNQGPGGSDVIWNFKDLKTINLEIDSVIYKSCAESPYCDSLPYASLASKTTNGWGYNYFSNDTNGFRVIGNIRPGESWSYSGYANLLSYPCTYGSRSVDTFYKVQHSTGNTSYTTDSFLADGYGTLILPYGTFEKVLRLHVYTKVSDYTAYSGSMHSSYYRKEEYRWYMADYHSPLLIMTFDPSGVTPVLSSILYYTNTKKASGVDDIDGNSSDMSVAPNPATNDLHIKLTLKSSGKVSISATDMMGRTVAAVQEQYVYSGAADIRYNVSALPAGMYILRVQTADGTELKKIQVAH